MKKSNDSFYTSMAKQAKDKVEGEVWVKVLKRRWEWMSVFTTDLVKICKNTVCLRAPPASFLLKLFLKTFSLFICFEDRLSVDSTIAVRINSIRPSVKFLSILREICFSEN